MWAVIKKDFLQFFYGWTGPVIFIILYLLVGFIIWVSPDTSVLSSGFADLSGFFSLAPYVFLFFIPALTMSSISEEYKRGTLQLLKSKPLTTGSLVGAKYLAILLLVTALILPLLVYYYSISRLALPVGNVDSGGISGSYWGLFLMLSSFAAIGIFSSSLSSNQLTGFVIGVGLCFLVCFGFDLMAGLPLFSGRMELLLEYLGINFHYSEMGRGLFRLEDLTYIISINIFFLYLTYLVVQRKKS